MSLIEHEAKLREAEVALDWMRVDRDRWRSQAQASKADADRLRQQHRGAVSTVETHLHEPSRAPKGVRQADFRRGWEAARQAALIALGGAEREYPE
jgi:chitinase